MSHFETTVIDEGTRLQAGMPRGAALEDSPLQAGGLLLRGVVLVTYVIDDPKHPYASEIPIAVYCDVLCYSGTVATKWRFLPRVLVSQEIGGIHRGRIWKPRATTLSVSEDKVDVEKGSNPASYDGDHVLIGFMDNAVNQPIILRGIPHPSIDTGNETQTLGHRVNLRVVDGDPDFWKHHGAHFGVTDTGDFLIDTTFANDGKLTTKGKEADPPTDGKGAQTCKLPQDATYQIQFLDMSNPAAPVIKVNLEIKKDVWHLQIGTGETLKIEGKDALAKLTLGDGAQHAVLGDNLQTWWGLVKTALDTFGTTHTHVCPAGTSGPPVPTLSTPDYQPSNNSTKVKMPNG